jgi:hypothetical protein
MSSQSESEIIGDWNNLKGTHYHLIFALWLLLRRQAVSVEFYQGNDLLAYPSISVPPLPSASSAEQYLPTINLRSPSAKDDWWIQLKATKAKWTMSELLKENLLINFIHNSLQSEKRNKTWKVWLVSQGETDSDKIIQFTKTPGDSPDLNRRFGEIVETVYKQLIEEDPDSFITSFQIRDTAFSILKQIAATAPFPLEFLKAEINYELSLAHPDREAVRQIGNLLVGAMVEDAAAGPKAAHAYNANWVNKIAQKPVIREDLLDENPISACDVAVRRNAALKDFNSGYFVPRELFEDVFSRFLLSEETCFVLLGASGTGKSWVGANAAVTTLQNQPRLLIPGTDFDSEKRLENLVAGELRRHSSAVWNDSQFLQKIKAVADGKARKPFVIILDDLLPTEDIEFYRRNLGRLARECKEAGIKLVLTCQRHVWNLLKLGKYIEPSEIFSFGTKESAAVPPNGDVTKNFNTEESDSAPPDSKAESFSFSTGGISPALKYSFVLSDFSPEEFEKAVRGRLPEKLAETVITQLRALAFIALRKPYFFSRYFEKNFAELQKPSAAPPANIDQLLDWTVRAALEEAAVEFQLTESDLSPALDRLVEVFWENRPKGITYHRTIESLRVYIGEKTDALIAVWRRAGFLTVEGDIRFADQLVADRIFAVFLERKIAEDLGFLTELDPQLDYGAVTAYLRHATQPTIVAEKLIKINSKWTSSVVAGLAQTGGGDWRVLGMLSALLAEHQYSDLGGEIYDALGQLAARSKRAYKWVAEMYLGDRARTWRRGALAFVSTLEYEPRRVEKAVRTRLSRVVEINRDFFDKDKRRKWILVNALDSFRSIKHLSAARAGHKIINRYKSLVGSDEVEENRRRDWYFIDDVDEVRGQIAVFEPDEFARLLSDLQNDNPVIRYRAAQALIKLAIAKPEMSKEGLSRRIEIENDSAVFKRLLVSAYHLIEEFSGALLMALNRSPTSNFVEGFRRTDGLMFELLGNLADKNPGEVSNLLPSNLEPREPDLQALLGEIFVYAWWRLSESSDEAIDRASFEFFDRLDLSAVTEEIRPFAVRSRAVSLLARMCLDLKIRASELTGRQRFYPNLDKEFLFIDFGNFFKKHLAELSGHESFEQFKQLLLECVRQSDPVNIYPLSRFREAVHRCGSECLELLTDIAAAMPEPVPLLDTLPHGWQAIRVVTVLLKRGRSDSSIVNFAKQVLSEQHPASTIQADAESRELLAQLGLLENNPEQSLREQRNAANRLSLFSDSSNAHAIAVFTAQNPDKFLEYLDAGIITVDDVLTLYALVDEARNWQAVLIARVYARMVNERPVNLREAGDLCEQMLLAVRSMSPSTVKEQYEAVYQTIFSFLKGETPQRPLILDFAGGNSENIIDESHRLCAEILHRIADTPADQRTKHWLDDLLYSRRWWEESDRFQFRDSLLIQGHGLYGIYFFPAVRLALLAANLSAREGDPAARIMRERCETQKLLKNREDLLDHNDLRNYDEEMLCYAFEDFDKAARTAPHDERIESLHGGVLLRLDRLSEAEAALKRSLDLPTSAGRFRAGTLYDLACVYARQNRFEECRQTLLESGKLKPLDKKWMTRDPDLKSVCNEEWFQKLLEDVDD